MVSSLGGASAPAQAPKDGEGKLFSTWPIEPDASRCCADHAASLAKPLETPSGEDLASWSGQASLIAISFRFEFPRASGLTVT